jgi:cytochrome c
MYDGGKIITGLVIFVVILLFPLWYNLGKAQYTEPELQLPEQEEECIEPTEWIRANHMELLDDWRDKVVRDGYALYVTAQGQEVEMSLQKTCMSCHTNKGEFCDKCHDTAAVSPYCWDCHVAPEEVSNGQ